LGPTIPNSQPRAAKKRSIVLQQALGERDLGDILARRLPVQILDEIPAAIRQQREELAQRQLLVEGRMTAIVDDHVE
jgi:hypothetical protein